MGLSALYNYPVGVAVTADGSLALVADRDAHTIRRIQVASGQVTVLAGSPGQVGSADGIGSAARFSTPYAVALSADGSLALVLDGGNFTIRKIVVATGQVTTLAGSPGQVGSADGAGAAARFNNPQDVALSADGSLALVADFGNHTIRRIQVASGQVSTLAGKAGESGSSDGTGATARFNFPVGVALDAKGSLALVADTTNQTIRRLQVASGQVTTLAGSPGLRGSLDGMGAAARFDAPYAVALNGAGSLAVVADTNNSTIRQIAVASGQVSTLAGTPGLQGNVDGVGAAARFARPYAVALSADGSFALVADTLNNAVRRVTLATRQVTTLLQEALPADTSADFVAGQPNFNSAIPNAFGLNAQSLNQPRGLATDPGSGRIYVADTGNHRVLSWPSAAAFGQGQPADRVLGQPNFTSATAGAGERGLKAPEGVAVGADGTVYVADTGNHRVLAYVAPLVSGQAAARVFGQPDFATATPNTGGVTAASLNGPHGLAVDLRLGLLYVADTGNQRVLQYRAPLAPGRGPAADLVLGQNGSFTSATPNLGGVSGRSLNGPQAVAVAPRSGLVYVADTGNHRVLRFGARAGGGGAGSVGAAAAEEFLSGDVVAGQPSGFDNTPDNGGPATGLESPAAVAVDPIGTVLVADTGNNRMLEFDNPAPPSTPSPPAPNRVFGQPDFTSSAPNTGGISRTSASGPRGVATDRDGNFLLADTSNHRVVAFAQPGATPTLLSLSPSTVTAGGGDFSLTVVGYNFYNPATVEWNGAAQPSTAVDGVTVQVTVPAALIAQAGPVSITVVNTPPTGQLTRSNALTLAVAPPAGTATCAVPARAAVAATATAAPPVRAAGLAGAAYLPAAVGFGLCAQPAAPARLAVNPGGDRPADADRPRAVPGKP